MDGINKLAGFRSLNLFLDDGGARLVERIRMDMRIDAVSVFGDGSALIGGGNILRRIMINAKDGLTTIDEKKEGFRNADGFLAKVCVMAAIPDGSVIIGGYNGALYRATIENDKMRLSERVEGFKDSEGFYANVYFIIPFWNDKILIGGNRGALYCATIENEEVRLGKKIDWLKYLPHYPSHILSAIFLDDGTLLASGNHCVVYRIGMDGSDGVCFIESVSGFKNAFGEDVNIHALALLHDGTVLAGGDAGALYRFEVKDDEISLGHRIVGFMDAAGHDADIRFIAPLLDNKVIIADNSGVIYCVTIEDDKVWFGERIDEWLKSTKGGYAHDRHSFALLGDGSILDGSQTGFLRHISLLDEAKSQNALSLLCDILH